MPTLLPGIQPLGTMMEIESDMLVDYLKLKNINLEMIHKLDNTIGKKLTHALNANKFSKPTTITKVLGPLSTTEKYTELNGGLLQTKLPQVLMLFGNFFPQLVVPLQFLDALTQLHSITIQQPLKTMDLVYLSLKDAKTQLLTTTQQVQTLPIIPFVLTLF